MAMATSSLESLRAGAYGAFDSKIHNMQTDDSKSRALSSCSISVSLCLRSSSSSPSSQSLVLLFSMIVSCFILSLSSLFPLSLSPTVRNPRRSHAEFWIGSLPSSDLRKLADSSLKVIAETCSGLFALALVNLCKLTDSALGYLPNVCLSIQSLKLCRNAFSDEAIAAFLETSGESLKELSLNNVKKVEHNMAISLARHSRRLLSLDLSKCRKLTKKEALGLITDCCLLLKVLKLFGCTQVMFICNHYPFVKHLKKDIVKLSKFYMKKELAVVAISSNSVATHPQVQMTNLKTRAALNPLYNLSNVELFLTGRTTIHGRKS